ncbi:primosomal replication protein PriC [Pasteurella sp. PK-2025]|uniref:primosomal replication protein PriC n=1 Tax=Pasteurella sp. PK-2025 TaxID=3413133 RepID=UPI003C71733E
MTKNELIAQLSQKVSQLYQQVAHKKNQRLQTDFDPQLFSENNQTYAFYFQQIQNTIQQLAQLKDNEVECCGFIIEKLLSQYVALSDTLTANHKATAPVLTQADKSHIHRLPPRERLSQYYTALHALNQKITDYEDQKDKCNDPTLQYQLQQRIAFNQQRRTKCLNAIESLEEYLRMKGKKSAPKP